MLYSDGVLYEVGCGRGVLADEQFPVSHRYLVHFLDTPCNAGTHNIGVFHDLILLQVSGTLEGELIERHITQHSALKSGNPSPARPNA